MTIIGRRRSRTRDLCIAVCSVMGVVLVWSRLANLGTSFWSDEAHSAYYYANRGPHGVFFGEYVPNNHVLFNLLSWATTGAVGRFEAAYRFWSVAPGIAAVALAAWWAAKRLGLLAAAVIVVLTTVSPVHLVLTPQARGYGLAMLAGVVMLIGAVRASDHESTRAVTVFAIGALVGIWTLPVFAVAAAAQAAVLLWNQRLRRATLIACGVIAAASLLFYAPMLSDIVHNADQEFGARLAVVGVVTGPYHHLAAPTIANAMPSGPHSLLNEVATFLAIALLTVAAVARLWRRSDRVLLAHLFVPIFGTYLALMVGRFYVQPRFASYLLFHVLLVLAIGAQQCWDLCSGVAPARALAAIVLAAVAITGTARVAHLTMAQARLPWENSRFVADLAKATHLAYIYTDSSHPVGFYYYLGARRVVQLPDPAIKRRAYCALRNRFIFVDDTYNQDVKPDLTCLTKRHAVKIIVPQQMYPPIRRPGILSVYLVPAARKS